LRQAQADLFRAFSNIHGLATLLSEPVQLIGMFRNTRSGCGISAVKRRSTRLAAAVVHAVADGLVFQGDDDDTLGCRRIVTDAAPHAEREHVHFQ
jgi:hypothetical protein